LGRVKKYRSKMFTYINRYIILYKVEVTLYKIIITKWALDSYLELKHKRTFSDEEFKSTLKPDVLLLRHYRDSPKFKNAKFWGVQKYRLECLFQTDLK
jgi:hypothetical protein